MLTGAIKSQINKLRDDLWSGGVSNPMTGVEQLTNLLFIRRLDEKYRNSLEKLLNADGKPHDIIEIICVSGK